MTTQSEKYARIMTVHDWIHKKKFSNKTLHQLIEKAFGLTSYEARHKLISDALAELSAGWKKEDLRIKNAERLDTLMEAAAENGDLKAAINAIQVQNRMFGLDTTKQDVEVKGETFDIKFG